MVDPNEPSGIVEGPNGELPFVSVVIPARNEEASIECAVAPFLVPQTLARIEVIVADGASTDRTREVVTSMSYRDPRVRLVDNPSHHTANGLNAAIRASRGEIILRMDGHAEPDPDYLAACLAVLGTTGAWNVGGRMHKVGVTRAGRAASAATTSAFGIGGGRRFHLVKEPVDLDGVWLGCWPRWVLERVGLFDPELLSDEDEELNQRILDAGGHIRFDPSITATYLSRGSWSRLIRQYARYGVYKVRAIQKRPTLLRIRHLIPAVFVAIVVGGLLGGVVSSLAPLAAIGAILLWLAASVWFARPVAPEFDSTIPEVVAAYLCLHVGYGAGMWIGFVRFAPRWFIDRRGTIPVLGTRSP